MAVGKLVYNYATMKFVGILQKNNPVDDLSGGQVDNWTTVLTTRCSLVKESGKLVDGAGKLEYNRTYTLVCRYQVAFGTLNAATINSDSRWLINGDTYKITDFERVDMTPHYMTFQVIK